MLNYTWKREENPTQETSIDLGLKPSKKGQTMNLTMSNFDQDNYASFKITLSYKKTDGIVKLEKF